MKYKLPFIFSVCVFCFSGSCSFSYSQERSYVFSVKGKWAFADGRFLYLFYRGPDNSYIKDSSVIREGNFLFQGKINGPVLADIYTKEDNKQKHISEFWIEPGEQNLVVTDAEYSKLTAQNSSLNNEFARFKQIKLSIDEKYKPQLDSLKGARDVEFISSIRERLSPYFKELENQEIEFFLKNPQSYVTAYMLNLYTSKLPLDSLQFFFNRMSPELQQSYYGKNFKNKINQIASGSPGSKAMNFIATDVSGKTLTLNDYRGSFVLLEFWASWCIPCRREHPTLIELYKTYAGKGIKFISIADDDTEPEKWREAIQKDKLIWPQVLRGRMDNSYSKEKELNRDINELYGVQSLPTLILINKEGVIVGRFESNIQDLKNVLNKYFNTVE